MLNASSICRVAVDHWLKSRLPWLFTPSLPLPPQREYDDMPLKTFYRYVLPQLPPAATGREDADSASAAPSAAPSAPPAPAAAEFSGLPPNKVLTLGMDEPESW